MSQLKIGALLQGGKYKIEKVLGQGGFGITYQATQELFDRKVCIKEFFLKQYCERDKATSHVTLGTQSSREIVERFMQKFLKEAKTIYNLKHPNIIHIHDIFKENNTAYYVMDYIDGENLNDMVKSRGALPEAEAVAYVKQVAMALDFVHQRKVNHLDVKPANIMVSRSDNRAILIDFGVSKQYDAQGEQTSTTPVAISHGYAPIEQYKQGGVSTFSPQTDIYALGATLYKLLTGETPPQAMDLIKEKLPPLPSIISKPVVEAIKKAMQVRQADRPSSISDFLEILQTKEKPEPPKDPDDADKYRQAAEQGDAEAQFKLGLCYYKGEGVPQNYAEAVKWYRKAAGQGYAQAQYNLGECYHKGEGVPKNYFAAVKWFRKAAEQGNALAQNKLGECYYSGLGVPKNYTEAVKWYRKAAEQGLASAQNNLGYSYKQGQGVPQNYTEAVKWYRQAAEQGYAPAQTNLGKCYCYGKGVPEDREEAVKWYCKAAEQGYAHAQYKLGECYYYGWGVPEDREEVVKWYCQAAEQNHALAKYKLGYYYENGWGVPVDKAEAVKWYRKAAELGNKLAQDELRKREIRNVWICIVSIVVAVLLISLLGIYLHEPEHIKQYREAAEQGNAIAQYDLGRSYANGYGVPEDYSEAAKWYSKAAEQGHIEAQYNLGRCYTNGEGVPVDKAEAVKWYRKAAYQGNAEAQYNLGLCYENGTGVSQNDTAAVKWYRKAADQGHADAQYTLEDLGETW